MQHRSDPELFVIPLAPSDYLIYAPLRRAALVGNAELLRFLRNDTSAEDVQPAIFTALRACGMVDGPPVEPPATPRAGPPRPLVATLLLTSACNLRCCYCYASSGDAPAAFMSFESARRAIDFVAANALAAHAPSFEVSYHGAGEPTQHWPLLVKSHLYARRVAESAGLRLRASLTTNGVFDAARCAWIAAHLNSATVSFDGLPEIQNAGRPTASGAASAAAVLTTLRAFDQANFRYSIRMTVTAETIPGLPQSVAYICRRFRPQAIQVEPVYQMGRGREAAGAETAAFLSAFRAARRTSPKAARLLRFSGARAGTLTNRFCGVANGNFCVAPSGAVSACHEVASETQPFAATFFYARPSAASAGYEFDECVYSNLRAQTVDHLDRCRDCFAKWNCAGDCYHKSLHAGPTRCEIIRELTKDQLLENIATSGGIYWKRPGPDGQLVK
jgi:uncharacterized protein